MQGEEDVVLDVTLNDIVVYTGGETNKDKKDDQVWTKENRESVSKLFKHLTLLALLINPSICLSQSESTKKKKKKNQKLGKHSLGCSFLVQRNYITSDTHKCLLNSCHGSAVRLMPLYRYEWTLEARREQAG